MGVMVKTFGVITHLFAGDLTQEKQLDIKGRGTKHF